MKPRIVHTALRDILVHVRALQHVISVVQVASAILLDQRIVNYVTLEPSAVRVSQRAQVVPLDPSVPILVQFRANYARLGPTQMIRGLELALSVPKVDILKLKAVHLKIVVFARLGHFKKVLGNPVDPVLQVLSIRKKGRHSAMIVQLGQCQPEVILNVWNVCLESLVAQMVLMDARIARLEGTALNQE